MIAELDQITRIENEHRPPSAKPTLGEAYAMLKSRWQAGRRDLETGLRLMFLAWYACAEPPCLTGLPSQGETASVFRDVFTAFGGARSTEPEFLHAVGLMCELSPWCCGQEDEWTAVGLECRTKARRLNPHSYPPEHFEGRGACGDYFANLIRACGGSSSA